MYQSEQNDKVCDLQSSNPVCFRTFFLEVLFTLEREPDSADDADLAATWSCSSQLTPAENKKKRHEFQEKKRKKKKNQF